MAKLSEYVKVAEAAEILGVSQGTVRTWADAESAKLEKAILKNLASLGFTGKESS